MTAPTVHRIEIGSILSSRTLVGAVELTINGDKIQMDLAKAREVRGMLDGAIEAAVTDEIVFRFMTTRVGMDPAAAAALLLELRELRQGTRETSWPV